MISGELSPNIQGRSDLEKYDMGMAKLYNWIVSYHGGMFTRPGTQFCEYLKLDTQNIKLFKFVFTPDTANTYILVFGHLYVRFVQDGSYVLEATKTITAINLGTSTITSNSHGYANGDWVYIEEVGGTTQLNNKYYIITGATTNTYQLQTPLGVAVSFASYSAFTSGGTSARVYTVVTPWTSDELTELKADATRDTVRLTAPSHRPRDLVRVSHASWTISPTVIANEVAVPTGLSITASDAGSSKAAAAVTAFHPEKGESLASAYAFITGAADITYRPSSLTYRWTPVDDVLYYNVYRSNIVPDQGPALTRAAEVGYIGRSFGAEFTDYNIVPDFTKTPPMHSNPFDNGVITHVNVTAAGTGYTTASALTVTDPTGTGFVGYVIPNSSAPNGIAAVVVVNGGKNYTAPVFSVTVGAGATFSAKIGPSSGNYPAVSAIFQQRQLFAGTDNEPLTIWGSKPGKFNNFDSSLVVVKDDSYEHEIDSSKAAKIKHMVPTRGGLLVMSSVGIWQLTGENGGAVTAISALADNQAYSGASDTPPVRIDTDLLYVESKGYTVRLLNYKDFYKVYRGEDVSVLSSHFFSKDKQIESMDYSAAPHRCVFAQRSDGALLAFTLLREQNVYAWSQLWTKGLFKDCIQVEENGLDVIYVVVERLLNGRVTKLLERFVFDEFEDAEDAWCVDCGLDLAGSPAVHTPSGRSPTFHNVSLQVVAATGSGVTATASGSIFVSGDVGKIIRGGGGKMTVASYISPTQITVNITTDITDLWPERSTDLPLPFPANTWTLDTPLTSVSGLDHLEGETVSLLGDGQVLPQQVVTNGAVTGLPNVTRLIVGLPYQCKAQTLPIVIPNVSVEHRRKRVVGMMVNQVRSRGLKVGSTLTNLRSFRERTTEAWGDPVSLQNGPKHIMIDPVWTEEGQVWFVQDDPLPVHVTAVVLQGEVGDDED